MPENFNHIPNLTGIDAEIFVENLDKEPTPEELTQIRNWSNIHVSL